MKKALIKGLVTVLVFILIGVVAIALAGMYKFNYLASKDGYDADGNKIKVENQQDRPYIGLNITQAQELAAKNGVPFRVTMADGNPLAVTMDYRPGRINASVEAGIVVDYQVEGEEAPR